MASHHRRLQLMMVRAASWLILIAAVTIATLTPAAQTGRAVMTADGFRIVTADLHVHAFLGDGALPPWDLRREAARRGIDVVAVTNHNQMYAARLDRALFSPPPHPVTVLGQELTMPNYHVIAIGIREPIDWRLPLQEAIRAIHAQGGVAIGAHPRGEDWQMLDRATLGTLDGLEVAHPVTADDPDTREDFDRLFEHARQTKPTIAPIGSSDYHFGAPMGFCRTRLLVRELSVAGVLEAIRAGRTVAYDSSGIAYGQAEWVAAVSKAPTPASPDSPRHHITMFAAWIALLILVVVGPRRKQGHSTFPQKETERKR